MTEKRNSAKAGSFMTQAQAKNSWVHYADAGTTLEDVQRPNYWCNVAGRMLLYDRVEVVFAELNAIADFVVLGIEDVTKCLTPNRLAQSAKLKLLNACNFPEPKEEKPSKGVYSFGQEGVLEIRPNLPKEEKPSEGVYSAKYTNYVKKWTVINGLNNAVVEDKISTKEEAELKAKELNGTI